MNAALWTLAAIINWADAAPVPGQCAEPAAGNAGRAGCFLVAELHIAPRDTPIWWHLHEFRSASAAAAASANLADTTTASSHGRFWVHVLGGGPQSPLASGTRVASVGPLVVPAGVPLLARFIESEFSPGMRTRVHSHPGPEAFYVLEGEQCMETPSTKRRLRTGEIFIVPPGPHVQAAPRGRKNLAVILSATGQEWMTMEPDWTPSQYCAE